MEITVMSWNLRDFDGPGQWAGERESRLGRIAAVIKDADPDIVCVQEIRGSVPHHSLARLGEGVGLDWTVTPGWIDYGDGDGEMPEPAVAVGDADFHVGILRRHEIATVQGSWRQIGRAAGGLWHSAATIAFDVGGPAPLTIVNCHLDPFSQDRRFNEAGRIASLALGRPAIVAGDFNGVSADRRLDGAYYDPDPLAQTGWHDAAIHQVLWDDDPDAPLRVDRRAAERLRRAGLGDAACMLDIPWQATTGHWPDDPHGERRIDRFLATAAAAPALTGYRVIGAETLHEPAGDERREDFADDPKALSDHLPVILQLDATALRAPGMRGT